MFSKRKDRQTQFTWEPKPDITAYELALALPMLVHGTGLWYYNDPIAVIEKLPEDARRHFKVINAANAA